MPVAHDEITWVDVAFWWLAAALVMSPVLGLIVVGIAEVAGGSP